MSKIKLAINGFGRIGRLSARLISMQYSDQIEIVGVNDLVDASNLAYLFKYDTSYGPYPMDVEAKGNQITIETEDETQQFKVYSERNPEDLPWKELGVDVVLECTGIFTTTESANSHIKAGAKKVIISAPAKDKETSTIVLGVNQEGIMDEIISNASCTTNCSAPALKVINDKYTIESAFGLTCHAYTASQTLQDGPVKKDFRDGRAAAMNMIPSSTGAAKAVIQVIPELEGKLSMSALRVPVITGSMVHIVIELKESGITVEEVNKAFEKAAQTDLEGILEYSEDELVSSDIVGNPHSTVFDSKLTEVTGNLVKIVIWYDNEWGYTNRLVEAVLVSLSE